MTSIAKSPAPQQTEEFGEARLGSSTNLRPGGLLSSSTTIRRLALTRFKDLLNLSSNSSIQLFLRDFVKTHISIFPDAPRFSLAPFSIHLLQTLHSKEEANKSDKRQTLHVCAQQKSKKNLHPKRVLPKPPLSVTKQNKTKTPKCRAKPHGMSCVSR